jgi:hypothetical protein
LRCARAEPGSRAALTPDLHGATLDKIDDEPHDRVRLHLTRLDGSVPAMIDSADKDSGRQFNAAPQRGTTLMPQHLYQQTVHDFHGIDNGFEFIVAQRHGNEFWDGRRRLWRFDVSHGNASSIEWMLDV